MNENYFRYLCFGWAALGILTRILMLWLGEKWDNWEIEKAYSEKKPIWIYIVSLSGFFLVVLTWYNVFTLNVKWSWLIAFILSLTLIKISAILFKYREFRNFVVNTLRNKKKKNKITLSVLFVSLVFILMGIFIY